MSEPKSNVALLKQDDFIKKSHEIVFSQLDLTPIEHDIFAMFLKRLAFDNREDYLLPNEDGKLVYTGKPLSYEFSSEELKNWFHIEPSVFKRVLYEPCKRLMGKNIGLKSKDEFKHTALFKEISYKRGVLTITPNDILLPAYFGGSRGHARVSDIEFRSLKKESSKKLYAILSRFKDHGSGTVGYRTLKELYGLFGLLDEEGGLKKQSFTKLSLFINRVIRPAIAEIELIEPRIRFYSDSSSPQYYGFRTGKEGRKVVKLEFLYYWDSTSKEQVLDQELTPLERAVVIHCKILANEEVTQDEIEILKTNLSDFVLSGNNVCDKAIELINTLT
ncbi:replication initiation protein [Vibrio sp. 10N.222.54.A1]|uniref:Initiator Rep protein WH1 domain-containing protein n=2 Tax=Vibrio TaxID=662 RepID=A0A2N7CIJ5_VIBSP|nr:MULTISPECIES: replication initiation protein [Vibrio]CAK3993191.1 Initiator Rep protein domain-containing protein [Vibrio crassostreae]PMF29755.1 hypothetical protein BCV19_24155 [Vibrio splendidus]PMK67095.1 hypothetical protein BCT93_22920 [Vibrio lentus]PML91644.1 hypothetical protein BCT66_25840 [Vibrio sp. 10N.261.49.E11]PMN83180.1 hypothetical protein BCT22_12445 [Vibrio sp. 10N.261.45.A1]